MQPPLLDKELVDMFMDTLQNPYFGMMLSNTSTGFSDLVKVGERIERGLRSERIQCASSSQASETESLSSSQEEEYDVDVVMA